MSARSPATIQDNRLDDVTSRTRSLWCAVILQAIEDATMKIPHWAPSGERVAQAQAREWLTSMSADFRETCGLAGLDAEAVCSRAATLMADLISGDRPPLSLRTLTFNGQSRSIKDWAQATGIPAGTISGRIKYGWPIDRVLSEPVNVNKSSRRRGAEQHDRGVGRVSSNVAGTGPSPTAQISG